MEVRPEEQYQWLLSGLSQVVFEETLKWLIVR